MADPFAPVTSGDPIPTDRVLWNAMIAAGLAHRQPQRPDQPATRRTVNGRVEQLALNSTGADLSFGKPVAVSAAGGYDLTDDAQALSWLRSGLLTLGEPTSSAEWVCVTTQPIPAGKIGWVAVSGVCLCDIDSAAGAAWASPQVGDTTALLGGTTGTVRVLHVPSSGGSQRRCAVYLHERPAGGSGLTTANEDGTEESTTTRLEFDQNTGVRVAAGATDGDPDTVSLIAASVSQMGAVTAPGSGGLQSLGSGDKYLSAGGLHVSGTISGGGLVGGTRAVDDITYQSKVRLIAYDYPNPVNDFYWDDVVSYGFADQRHGRGAVTTDTYGVGSVNYVGYMCGPLRQSQNLNGEPTLGHGTPKSHTFALIGPNPHSETGGVSSVGYMLTEGGEAWYGGTANVVIGSVTLRFRGGLYIDHFTTGSPPPPTVPPPPVPPVPPPPPPGTISLTIFVAETGVGPIAGRQITCPEATNSPQTTDAGGLCVLEEVPVVALGTTSVTLNGSGETVTHTYYAEIGAGAGGTGYSFSPRVDLGNVTGLFEITDPDDELVVIDPEEPVDPP